MGTEYLIGRRAPVSRRRGARPFAWPSVRLAASRTKLGELAAAWRRSTATGQPGAYCGGEPLRVLRRCLRTLRRPLPRALFKQNGSPLPEQQARRPASRVPLRAKSQSRGPYDGARDHGRRVRRDIRAVAEELHVLERAGGVDRRAPSEAPQRIGIVELSALQNRVPARSIVQPCQHVRSLGVLLRRDVHRAVAVEIEEAMFQMRAFSRRPGARAKAAWRLVDEHSAAAIHQQLHAPPRLPVL